MYSCAGFIFFAQSEACFYGKIIFCSYFNGKLIVNAIYERIVVCKAEFREMESL